MTKNRPNESWGGNAACHAWKLPLQGVDFARRVLSILSERASSPYESYVALSYAKRAVAVEYLDRLRFRLKNECDGNAEEKLPEKFLKDAQNMIEETL